jgi:hypothetical protein
MGLVKAQGTKHMTNLKAMQSAISALDSGHWGHGIPEAYAILYEAIEKEKKQPAREWVGLTPEDYDSMRPRVPYIVNDFSFADVAAIVEAKLKELNT